MCWACHSCRVDPQLFALLASATHPYNHRRSKSSIHHCCVEPLSPLKPLSPLESLSLAPFVYIFYFHHRWSKFVQWRPGPCPHCLWMEPLLSRWGGWVCMLSDVRQGCKEMGCRSLFQTCGFSGSGTVRAVGKGLQWPAILL